MASTSSGCVGLPRPHDGALPTAADLTAHFSLYAPAGASHELTAPEARCGCEDCKRWAAHVKTGGPHGQPLYLVPTADLADGIARWLVKQQQDLGQPVVALEVGAGDGALAHTLRCALSRLQSGNNITIIATDSGARGLKTVEGAEPVLKLDASKAAATFSPHVVIVAFMPLGVDWTAAFRATPSVRSYLLLGETDDGCCGRPWSTWGYMCDGDDDARDVRVSSTSGSSDEDVDGDDEAEAKAGGGEEEEAKAGGGEEEEAKAGGGDDGAEAQAGGGEEEEADTEAQGTKKRRRDLLQAQQSGKRATHSLQAHEAWRRVYQYEPHRTPWGAAGWERIEPVEEICERSLVCCTDVCWSARRHAKAVCFRRREDARKLQSESN
jgi:hypothetical protein